MCDLYVAKCPKCSKTTPMHLEDFATEQDEVRVWCRKHAPKTMRNMTFHYRDCNHGRWSVCVVESLTDNAWNNRMGNHPNAGYIKELDDERTA